MDRIAKHVMKGIMLCIVSVALLHPTVTHAAEMYQAQSHSIKVYGHVDKSFIITVPIDGIANIFRVHV